MTSKILKRLHFVCFVSSPIPSLLLMVQRNPSQAMWNHLVPSWCTMISEVKRWGEQESKKYRLRQTTSRSSLLVAHQGDVSRKLNQAFLLVDSFNFNSLNWTHSIQLQSYNAWCHRSEIPTSQNLALSSLTAGGLIHRSLWWNLIDIMARTFRSKWFYTVHVLPHQPPYTTNLNPNVCGITKAWPLTLFLRNVMLKLAQKDRTVTPCNIIWSLPTGTCKLTHNLTSFEENADWAVQWWFVKLNILKYELARQLITKQYTQSSNTRENWHMSV